MSSSSNTKQRTMAFFSRSSDSSEEDGDKYHETGPPSKRRKMSPKQQQAASRIVGSSKKIIPRRTVSPRTHQPEIIDLMLSSDDDDDRKMPARRVSTSPPAVAMMPKQQKLKTAPGESTVERKERAIPRKSEPSSARTSTSTASTASTSTASAPLPPAAAPAESLQSLGEWLQNATPEELERLNAEAMRSSAEQARPAKVKTLRQSSQDVDGNIERFLNKATPRIAQDNDNSDAIAVSEQVNNDDVTPYGKAMAGLSRDEIEALNDQALKRAMEGPEDVDYPYTLDEFKREFIESAERNGQLDHEELEHSKAVRDPNTKISREDCTDQEKAQYGRTMLSGGQRLFSAEIGNLTRGEIFCDIGSGIGNLVHQAAYTTGCAESRGIELIDGRFRIGEAFDRFYKGQHKKVSDKAGSKRFVGGIKIRQGGLAEKAHREFLTADVDLLYCNNYNDVFGVRANNTGEVSYCPDDYIAGLLTQLAPGAKLVTLSEIRRLPPPLKEANEIRKANGLPEHEQASFYELKTVEDEGGEDKLTFTEMPYTIYIYTRTGDATFLCDVARCAYAKNATPILAYTTIEEGNHDERLVTVAECPCCATPRRARRKRKEVESYKES